MRVLFHFEQKFITKPFILRYNGDVERRNNMSKYSLIGIWDQIFPGQNEAIDYAGRKMMRSAIGNQNSRFCPTIDHIRPLSNGGKDCLANIVICNQKTNAEKADSFPNWTANSKRFQAKRVRGTSDEYDIYQLD